MDNTNKNNMLGERALKRFEPTKVYYEEGIERYQLGRELICRYRDQGVEMETITSHNRIEHLLHRPNEEYTAMKQFLILGVRKTLRLIPNERSADFIVPFTSTGCSAMCLYCYLTCHFHLNSYLRVFVNREEIFESIRRTLHRERRDLSFEIGSNSDLVLEDSVSGSLRWAIEEFGKLDRATATFATKFDGIDNILDARHNGRTQVRISVNPQPLVSRIELGTSSLKQRIEAANQLYRAGYRVGLNIAPVILVDGWEKLYGDMLDELSDTLLPSLQQRLFIEIIFMTYASANHFINSAAFPGAPNLLERERMRPKGRGKYCYRDEVRVPAQHLLEAMVSKHFPQADIRYIV